MSCTLIDLGVDWVSAADKKTIAEAKISGLLQGLFDHSLKEARAGFKMHPNTQRFQKNLIKRKVPN